MTTKKRRRKLPLLASRVSEDRDLMKALLREVLKEVLEGGNDRVSGRSPLAAHRRQARLAGRRSQPGRSDAHGQADATGTAGPQR